MAKRTISKQIAMLRKNGPNDYKGFVYFFQCGEFVKIGSSRDPRKRCDVFNTSTPYHCEILAVHPCRTKSEAWLLEKEFHRSVKESRHRGEWFRHTAEVQALIDQAIKRTEEILNPLERMYKLSSIAKIAKVDLRTVKKHVEKGALKVQRIGPHKSIRVAHSEMLKYTKVSA